MTQFEEGDIVRLKSGGPEMTVTGIGTSTIDMRLNVVDHSNPIYCQWFDSKNLLKGTFVASTLQKVDRMDSAGPIGGDGIVIL